MRPQRLCVVQRRYFGRIPGLSLHFDAGLRRDPGDHLGELCPGDGHRGDVRPQQGQDGQITDGTSNTYMAGEKYCNPDNYANGLDGWDDQGWNIGRDWDNTRWAGNNGTWGNTQWAGNAAAFQPFQDRPGLGQGAAFGSAHANGFQMAFCDGSVRMTSYSIDPETHHCLGVRNDGKRIDAKLW